MGGGFLTAVGSRRSQDWVLIGKKRNKKTMTGKEGM